MKCEDCLGIIEEYFDAELDGRRSQQVAKHLAACVICNEVYESLKQEEQLYAHYEREVEVTSALWQGVQARITLESTRPEPGQPGGVIERLRRFFTESLHAPRFSPALAAALVVIAVGATVLVMNYVNSHSKETILAGGNSNSNGAVPEDANANKSQLLEKAQGAERNANTPENRDHQSDPEKKQTTKAQDGTQVVAVKTSPDSTPRHMPVEKVSAVKANATAEALLRDAEQKYIAAIAILQRDFDKRRSKLDPQLVAKLEASLASIDSTIAETRKAVRQNFDDPIAVQYMLTAYAKKVEILRDVTAN